MIEYKLSTSDQDYCKISFNAMASPCEVLIKTANQNFCHDLARLITKEVNRIETKYSRYQATSFIYKINTSNGTQQSIDPETFQLLNYAKELYELSDGLFDITSGVLGELWNFKEQTSTPSHHEVSVALSFIGFNKINYSEKSMTLPKGMQIDFGGIGKEYAVDRLAEILCTHCESEKLSYLINLGGDLLAKTYPQESVISHWKIGLENSNKGFIELINGAVATSGTSQRHFKHNGKVYSHLLNPKTGWPIENTPKSVTCFADSCVLAGTFSSLAMLQGIHAESFLESQKIQHLIEKQLTFY